MSRSDDEHEGIRFEKMNRRYGSRGREFPDIRGHYAGCAGKKRYRDRTEAMEDIRSFKKKSRRDIIPDRSYFCRKCRGWHITSQQSHY